MSQNTSLCLSSIDTPACPMAPWCCGTASFISLLYTDVAVVPLSTKEIWLIDWLIDQLKGFVISSYYLYGYISWDQIANCEGNNWKRCLHILHKWCVFSIRTILLCCRVSKKCFFSIACVSRNPKGFTLNVNGYIWVFLFLSRQRSWAD